MADLEIPLKASPSLQYQNLSYGDSKFVYVHKTEAHLLNVSSREVSSIQVKDKTPVFQAKVVSIGGQKLLVLATQGGAQIWDISKEKALVVVPFSEEEGKENFLSRGIASVGPLVAIGHSTGGISIIEVRSEGGSLVNTLKEHREMITDIASGEVNGEVLLVSADIAGDIIIWDPSLSPRAKINTPGDTATSIAITPTHIICGFGSGMIRIFTPQGKKYAEIAAHSRWINSIAYTTSNNTLVSVSEDMLVQFWKMPTSSDPKVALKGHKFVKDCLLTGVSFLDDGGRVGVVAYDTEKLFVFEVPQ